MFKVSSSFTIVYASQTGQAKSIAELIHDQAKQIAFTVDLFDIKYTNLSTIKNPLVFICSTTGDGEVPESAIKAYKKLRLETNINALSHLKYALLGLGDTNYTQFCNGPKLFHQQLQRLSATCFYGPFYADDGTGLDLTVEPFIEGLWSALGKQLQPQAIDLDLSQLSLKNKLEAPKLGIQELTVPQLNTQSLFISFVLDSIVACKNDDDNYEILKKYYPGLLHKAKISQTKIITKLRENIKKCFQINFTRVDGDFKYEAGDSIDVLVQNDDHELNELFDLLQITRENRHKQIRLKNESEKKSLASRVSLVNTTQISLWTLFKHFIDIRSTSLKKSVLRVLAEYCTSDVERYHLLELSSKEGSKKYDELIRESQMNLVGLLNKFKSCRPNVDHLIQLLDSLSMRSYSLSSYDSLNKHDTENTMEFIFKLVEFKNGLKGVGTNYLSKLREGDCFYFLKRKLQNFTLPDDFIRKPMILIGPGSGIAPYISFLKARVHAIAENNSELDNETSKWWLFFGCRDSQADFLYKEDLLAFAKDKRLLHQFYVSYSQYVAEEDLNEYHLGGTKYVQDAIRIKKQEIIDLIVNHQAYIYVCGDAKNMSKDVFNCLCECLIELKPDIVDAKKYLIDLMSAKRYRQDIWS